MTTTHSSTAGSQPHSAPLYGAPPYYYRGFTSLAVSWRTDHEAAQAVLPPGFSLGATGAVVTATFSRYGITSFGPYNEFVMTLPVDVETDAGVRSGVYSPFLYVDSDGPLAAGRELWGFGKKLAEIDLGQRYDVSWATATRPAAVALATASLKLDAPLADADVDDVPVFSFRSIPSPSFHGPEGQVRQIIESRFTCVPRVDDDGVVAVWSGTRAHIAFPANSAVDPLHGLPVIEPLGGTWGAFDAVLTAGTVVRDLDA